MTSILHEISLPTIQHVRTIYLQFWQACIALLDHQIDQEERTKTCTDSDPSITPTTCSFTLLLLPVTPSANKFRKKGVANDSTFQKVHHNTIVSWFIVVGSLKYNRNRLISWWLILSIKEITDVKIRITKKTRIGIWKLKCMWGSNSKTKIRIFKHEKDLFLEKIYSVLTQRKCFTINPLTTTNVTYMLEWRTWRIFINSFCRSSVYVTFCSLRTCQNWAFSSRWNVSKPKTLCPISHFQKQFDWLFCVELFSNKIGCVGL